MIHKPLLHSPIDQNSDGFLERKFGLSFAHCYFHLPRVSGHLDGEIADLPRDPLQMQPDQKHISSHLTKAVLSPPHHSLRTAPVCLDLLTLQTRTVSKR